MSRTPFPARSDAPDFAALLVDSVPTGLVVLDREGRLLFANRAFRKAFDLGDADLSGWHLEEVVPSLAIRRRIDEALQGGGGPRAFLLDHAGGDGGRVLRATLAPAPEGPGPRRLLLLLDDLSDEMRLLETASKARERLEREHTVLEALLDNMLAGVAACDGAGTLAYLNSTARRLLGRSASPVGPRDWPAEFGLLAADGETPLPWDQHPLHLALLEGSVRDREMCVSDGTGGLRLLRVGGQRMTSHSGEVYGAVIVMHDVSDQRRAEQAQARLEAQLRQAQKMEAIGGLAGGVAHDFNNILTAVLGYADLMLDSLKEGDPLRHEVTEIVKAAERGARLTQQLLAFSRRQVLEPRVIDLNEVVEGISSMLRRLIGENVELATVLAREPVRTFADPGKVEQVLMNLVVNARDAMRGGGRVTVRTDCVDLSEEFCLMHAGSRPGPQASLCVEDTGTGMDSATLARIFEPFFTTKEKGKGTGLGLATVYGIVKQTGGAIVVESERGKGTTFRIFLPRAAAAAPQAEPAEERPSGRGAARGRETVLLVEDEEVVRTLVSDVLRLHGYDVLVAQTGEAALEAAEARGAPLDLLVTDLVLPGFGGVELANRLRERFPALVVLFVSGYAERDAESRGVALPGAAFLQKPFSPGVLTRRVRDLLDARAS